MEITQSQFIIGFMIFSSLAFTIGVKIFLYRVLYKRHDSDDKN